MSFCTQCGKQLLDGQVCGCTTVNQFCTECGSRIHNSRPCPCTVKPPSPPPIDEGPAPGSGYGKYALEDDVPEINQDYDNNTYTNSYFAASITGEIPIRQYHIALLCGWTRVVWAHGYMQITSKRVIFKAEGRKQTCVQRELALKEIAGIEAVNGYRFSIPHFLMGLAVILAGAVLMALVTFMGGWAVTNIFVTRPPALEYLRQSIDMITGDGAVQVSRLSLIIGLVAGFGGGTLYFLLRGKPWLKIILLGLSLGGFFVVGLSGGVFALMLLVMGTVVCVYGMIVFAWLPDLVITVYTPAGVGVDMMRANRLGAVLCGRASAGYAEAAPTVETDSAVYEIGAIIADVQTLGDAGAEKWRQA